MAGAVSLAVTLGLAVGSVACLGAVAPVPSGMSSACESGTIRFAAGFKPTKPADYVGERLESTSPRTSTPVAVPSSSGSATAPPVGSSTGSQKEAAREVTSGSDSVGTACANASDRVACQKKLEQESVIGATCQGIVVVPKVRDVAFAPEAAAPPPAGSCSATFYAYTRGDEVGNLSTRALALEFFGTIDSPEEALFLVKLSGESLSCAAEAPAAWRATADGYDVQSSAVDRCGEVTVRKILHVSAQGTITVVSSEKVSDPC
jgi:hypothetical protein